LTPYAGTGQAGFSGDGGPALKAQLDQPTGVVADSTAVYFADSANNRVRAVFSGPAPVLPDSPLAVLLPLAAAAVGAGGVAWRVRRRRRLAA
jgi:hypothetical protein